MRFLQPDTVIPDLYNPQSYNRYSYALNNPIRYTDPDGHFAIIPAVIAIAAVIGIWLIAAPPAYAPASDADLATRVTAAESNPTYNLGRWIDDHPIEYVTTIVVAVHLSWEAIVHLVDKASDPPLNDRGDPYPQVTDPRTGEPIPFPDDPQWTPKDQRNPRPSTYRDDYMEEWAERGYPEPDGGWDDKKIHHIEPLEYGGDNSFENGVPLTQQEHDRFTRWWKGGYNRPQ
jgi:hypothetical protein